MRSDEPGIRARGAKLFFNAIAALLQRVSAAGVSAGSRAPVFRGDSTRGPFRLQEHLGERPVIVFFFPDETLSPG